MRVEGEGEGEVEGEGEGEGEGGGSYGVDLVEVLLEVIPRDPEGAIVPEGDAERLECLVRARG